MKYITNSLQKLIIMINWYYNVYLLFCSVKLFSCSRCARADNYDNPTSKTVTRYFVPNKIQIAEIPPNRSIGFIFCPLSARFLKETSINFNETVSDNSCNIIFSLFYLTLDVKVVCKYHFIRLYFRSCLKEARRY